jgi:hypothetical protein
VTDILDGYEILKAVRSSSGRSILLLLGRKGKVELAVCIIYPHSHWKR